MRTLKKVLTFNHDLKIAEVHLYLDDVFTDVTIRIDPPKVLESGEVEDTTEETFDDTICVILNELEKEFNITPVEREEYIGVLNEGEFEIDKSTITTDIIERYEPTT